MASLLLCYSLWNKKKQVQYLENPPKITCFEPKTFDLILQLGGTYAIMGRESLDSSHLHRQSRCVWDTHMTTSILSWIKFYKIAVKVRIFFRLLLFIAQLLKANQGGNRISKDSSMLQKTVLDAHATKNSQNQNQGHFTQ